MTTIAHSSFAGADGGHLRVPSGLRVRGREAREHRAASTSRHRAASESVRLCLNHLHMGVDSRIGIASVLGYHGREGHFISPAERRRPPGNSFLRLRPSWDAVSQFLRCRIVFGLRTVCEFDPGQIACIVTDLESEYFSHLPFPLPMWDSIF